MHIPASAPLPLFGVGQAHPLRRHGADVVVGVKVGLLDLASINHVNDVIYGDAVRKRRERREERENQIFKAVCEEASAKTHMQSFSVKT